MVSCLPRFASAVVLDVNGGTVRPINVRVFPYEWEPEIGWHPDSTRITMFGTTGPLGRPLR
jgi:hypothetical protein